jgi:hypothetical protein
MRQTAYLKEIQGTELKFMSLSESSNQRRSQRVTLQVVVLIKAIMPDGRCVQVQAFTSVVNAHGGLVESSLKLATNQKILLINPHSGIEVGCTVVRVEGPTSAVYEVAFEFDQRTPRFWLINLPPEDWAVEEAIASDNH